jgi:hypothetical protein
MLTPEIVLLGGPNSGKTHYAGQLYGRLQRSDGVLRLRREEGAPEDISALQEVLRNLENGCATPHTPISTWAEVSLPLIDNVGSKFDLRWPDYGGEQLKQIFSSRLVNKDWQEKLSKASGWVLLIRLNAEVTYKDAFERLAKPEKPEIAEQVDLDIIKAWDSNAYWVEILQLLLHIANLGTVAPLQSPRLAVLLSCYDELGNPEESPAELLANKLPLVASFIRNNWCTETVSIWGLSALGQELTGSSNAETFIDDGPERQGWVIPPDGVDPDVDISLPIKWLLS